MKKKKKKHLKRIIKHALDTMQDLSMNLIETSDQLHYAEDRVAQQFHHIQEQDRAIKGYRKNRDDIKEQYNRIREQLVQETKLCREMQSDYAELFSNAEKITAENNRLRELTKQLQQV